MRSKGQSNEREGVRASWRAGSGRGFTLVELITATAIFSIILAATFYAFRVAAETERRVRFRSIVMQNGRVALDRMTRILRGAYRPRYTHKDFFEGVDEELDGLADDSACFYSVFATPMAFDQPEGDICEVEFFIMRGDEEGEAGLFMRRDPGFDDRPRQGGFVTQLADGVIGLDLSYYVAGLWQDDWDADLETGFPEAVTVTLTLVAPDGRGLAMNLSSVAIIGRAD